MNVSYQWLSDYVDLTGCTAEELAEKLTRGGIEVDGVEHRNKGVKQVVVGRVTAKEKHPDADKLNVCEVDAGQGETLQIVCGAKNVAAGQKVPVALIGAVLPGNFKIKKAKLRGVESQGMICSAKELGMNERLLPKEIQEGILVLPDDTPIGADACEVLGLNDAVLDLDLTPNRSDCLSMVGVAYEIAALLGRDVRLPQPAETIIRSAAKAEEALGIQISTPACVHYTAALIENVTIGPSPLWIQNRLLAAGIRPISNIVDITNFVMLEYGQPLHAFDADSLTDGQIEVRQALQGEKLTTLDDVKRSLDPEMMVIASGGKAVGLAGVMGGANSEVGSGTRRILLESAKFSGSSVRKTSRKLGLRSEASLRFEKEVDPAAVIPALNRAVSLMSQYGGGQAAHGFAEAKTQNLPHETVIELSAGRVNRFLGTSLEPEEIRDLLLKLHFSVEESDHADGALDDLELKKMMLDIDSYQDEPELEALQDEIGLNVGPEEIEFELDTMAVTVPSRRGDITREVDLIEEVARLYGYDNIPTTPISGETTPGHLSPNQRVRRLLRAMLTNLGLHEVVNYSLNHPQQLNRTAGLYEPAVPVRLIMPMSEERSVLRTSLLPHLLEVAAYNRNRNTEDIAIFEIGSVFIAGEQKLSRLPDEHAVLGMLISGGLEEQNWNAAGRKADFYDLKGIIERIGEALGLERLEFAAASPAGFHPGRTADIYVHRQGKREWLGRLGQIHPAVQAEKDLEETFAAELDLAVLYRCAESGIQFRPLPRYPSVTRDLALVVDRALPVVNLQQSIRETVRQTDLTLETGGKAADPSAGKANLEALKVFDIYVGEHVAADKKSVALSLTFRHPDRTLTDDEVARLQDAIVSDLLENYGAELRK